MKLLILLFLSASLSSFVHAQTTIPPIEQKIQRILDSGIYDSFTAKQVSRIGDAAAVALTRVLRDKIVTDNDIHFALVVINEAFARPEIVENVSDREPRTALLLL